MILTHGNIKKSRILKYIFLDLPDDELLSAYEENSAQYTIFDGLHDSKIRITKSGSDIVIDFSKSRHGGTQTPRSITFSDAKIISQNRVSKNGHIAKLNKKVVPQEMGYQEIYTHCGQNYITFVFFYQKKTKKRSFSKMLVTIRFREIK